MQYYDRIKELRIDADIETSQSYYSEYELGKRPLPISHLKTLCEFYGVSADYILGLSKNLMWPR